MSVSAESLIDIVAMASENSGADFPPQPVEVAHLGDTNVKTPEEPKLEDLIEANQNPFTALESRPSSKSDAASAEAAMRSLDLKVSALCTCYQYSD